MLARLTVLVAGLLGATLTALSAPRLRAERRFADDAAALRAHGSPDGFRAGIPTTFRAGWRLGEADEFPFFYARVRAAHYDAGDDGAPCAGHGGTVGTHATPASADAPAGAGGSADPR